MSALHRVVSIAAMLFVLIVVTLGLVWPVQSLSFALGSAAALLRLIARIQTEPINYFVWFRVALIAIAALIDLVLLGAIRAVATRPQVTQAAGK